MIALAEREAKSKAKRSNQKNKKCRHIRLQAMLCPSMLPPGILFPFPFLISLPSLSAAYSVLFCCYDPVLAPSKRKKKAQDVRGIDDIICLS
jgi:hypothetical protein